MFFFRSALASPELCWNNNSWSKAEETKTTCFDYLSGVPCGHWYVREWKARGLKCITIMTIMVFRWFQILSVSWRKTCKQACAHGSYVKCRCFIQCHDWHWARNAGWNFLTAGSGPIRLPMGAAGSYGILPTIAYMLSNGTEPNPLADGIVCSMAHPMVNGRQSSQCVS